MKRLLIVALIAAAASACAQERSVVATQDDAARLPQTVELGLEDFSSPFTKETVLRLNAIVSKSLETIRDYDGSIALVRAAVDAGAEPDADAETRAKATKALSSLARLSENAAAARTEMDAAVAALKASGEKYNESLLAGMVRFVEQVDDELRAEHANLSARFG